MKAALFALAPVACTDAEPAPANRVYWACECAEECDHALETTWHVACAGPEVEDVDPETADMTHECALEKESRECGGWTCLCVCRVTSEPC